MAHGGYRNRKKNHGEAVLAADDAFNRGLASAAFGDTFTVYLRTATSNDATVASSRRLYGICSNTKEGLCIIKLW